MKTLEQIVAGQSLAFRQHLDEESWGARKLTVVDLDEAQSNLLRERGCVALDEALKAEGSWLFPATDITQPRAIRTYVRLGHDAGQPQACIIAPADDANLQSLAQAITQMVQQRTGVKLQTFTPEQADAALPEMAVDSDVILLGGAHENAWALRLALQTQALFVDAHVPGPDGWCIVTHHNFSQMSRNVLQVAAGTAHHGVVLEHLREAMMQSEGGWQWPSLHLIGMGTLMQRHFPSWEAFIQTLPPAGRLPNTDQPLPLEPQKLAAWIAMGLDCGGPEGNRYNAGPIDLTIMVARYYLLSADPRGLALFKALLSQLAAYYLKTPGGASYPSDLDFRLGPLLIHFQRLEHLFTNEERLLFLNLFLACVRAVNEYAHTFWPMTRFTGQTLHNHGTFKARTLAYAARYFQPYGIKGMERWREYVDHLFKHDASFWQRSKQIENANLYEGFVYEHALCYCHLQQPSLSLFPKRVLGELADRQIVATDNFFRAVDYGDANVTTTPGRSAFMQLMVAEDDDARRRWFCEESFVRKPDYLPLFLREFPGIAQTQPPQPKAAAGWELAPMDAHFHRDMQGRVPLEKCFDKLACRTGWGQDDQYVLVEGVGGKAISHSHVDPMNIVRMNHLGRMWLVSNGYGRRVGITNVSKSYASRERGPIDHNMLVLHKHSELVNDTPHFASLLARQSQGQVHLVKMQLADYSGVNWQRTIIMAQHAFMLVLDHVQVQDQGLSQAHIEWNAPGSQQNQGDVVRLSQQGVHLDIQTAGRWQREDDVADQSANWQDVLSQKQYPYADFPLRKLRYLMPDVSQGSSSTLATLFAVTTGDTPAWQLAHEGSQGLRVSAAGASQAKQSWFESPVAITGEDFQLKAEAGALTFSSKA